MADPPGLRPRSLLLLLEAASVFGGVVELGFRAESVFGGVIELEAC